MRHVHRSAVALLGLIMPFLLLAPPAEAATGPAWTSLQITHNWTVNIRPQLDDRHLVWQAYNGTNWDIESYDLATGAIDPLANGPQDETDPRLDGDRVLYIGHERPSSPAPDDYSSPDYSVTALYLHDLSTGQASRIPESEGVQDANFQGNLIVWHAGVGTKAEVYVHDLSTGETTRLTNDQYHARPPQTDGRLVAFEIDRGTDGLATRSTVSVYDAATGATRLLSTPTRDGSSPKVNAGRVVWSETDGTDGYIFLWDSTAPDRTALLSVTEGRQQYQPVIGGSNVAWLRETRPPDPAGDNTAVILHDLSTERETVVAQDIERSGLWLQGDGKLLVYGMRVQLYAYDTEAGGTPVHLDPDPERLSFGGPPDGQQSLGRGASLGFGRAGGEYIVGPSLSGGTVAFATYQFTNPVYWDFDIVLASRGTSPPAPAVPSPPTRRFADATGSPYEQAVNQLADRGIVRGYRDGDRLLFNPKGPVLRWQFLRMLLDATDVRFWYYSAQPPFTDRFGTQDGRPAEDNFLRRVLAAGYELGIARGLTANTFGPYSPLTRAQAASMLVRAAEAKRKGSMAIPDFYYPGSDMGGVTGPHGDNLKRAEYHGLLAGLVGFGPDWAPFAEMTRGEAAQVLWNLMQTF